METLRKKVQSLYDSGDLLGFSVCSDSGSILHNESFLSDEAAETATAPFISCSKLLAESDREVQRLTVELDDVILIYIHTDQGHALFTLGQDCDLDHAASIIA